MNLTNTTAWEPHRIAHPLHNPHPDQEEENTVWIPGGRQGAYGLEVTTPDGGVGSVANKFTVK